GENRVIAAKSDHVLTAGWNVCDGDEPSEAWKLAAKHVFGRFQACLELESCMSAFAQYRFSVKTAWRQRQIVCVLHFAGCLADSRSSCNWAGERQHHVIGVERLHAAR